MVSEAGFEPAKPVLRGIIAWSHPIGVSHFHHSDKNKTYA